MQVLEDIRKVLAYNLKQLRGKESQERFAERAKIPYRTYQDMESGNMMPQAANIAAVASVHKVSETRLFLDPDFVPSTIWRDLIHALSTLDDAQIRRYLAAIQAEVTAASGADRNNGLRPRQLKKPG